MPAVHVVQTSKIIVIPKPIFQKWE